jgi:hypothetical protein
VRFGQLACEKIILVYVQTRLTVKSDLKELLKKKDQYLTEIAMF